MKTFICSIIFFAIVFYWGRKKKKMEILIEGLVIGVVTGICVSFITDVDFRAKIIGPVIMIAHKVDSSIKYDSNNWMNIEATQTGKDSYVVSAKNINTGTTIKFPVDNVSRLPADLKYSILSSDTTVVFPGDYADLN